MKELNLTVVTKKVGEDAVVSQLPNTVDAFQGFVGGYLSTQRVFAGDPAVLLVCNEEAKELNLPKNFPFYEEESGEKIDMIRGDFCFVGCDAEGAFCSLTKQQAERCLTYCSRIVVSAG